MIVIHIGLRKAGSSSLQWFLSDNEGALASLSLDYPRIGRLERIAHHNLANEITGHRKFDPGYGTVSELSDHWRTAPTRSMVLSSEAFQEAESSQILGMKESLLGARGNDEFRIYLVIRDLVDLIPSSYSQRIKGGRQTYDFDAFFLKRISARRVNFFATARQWAKVFGWDSLHVRVLDPRYLVNGDLLDDFMSTCGLEPGRSPLGLVKPDAAANPTPGWKVIEAVRALTNGRHGLSPEHPLLAGMRRIDGKALARVASQIGKQLGWGEDRGRYLTRAQAQRCFDAYKASVDALNRFVSAPLPLPDDLDSRGFSEREFIPDATHIPENELQAFYDDLNLLILATLTDTPCERT